MLQKRKQYLPTEPFSLDFRSQKLSDKQFETLCKYNPELKFELSARGELSIMPPTSPESGWRNSRLTRRIGNWVEETGNGIDFDSSTIFTLKNGAKRSPDVSWMTREKWNSLSDAEKKTFSRIVPDFVIELRSFSDDLKPLQNKMKEYMENGVRLGWLIDPITKTVHIYRENKPVEILKNPLKLSGENVLEGFELNVREVF
jgi:Uma2 family endonuclease